MRFKEFQTVESAIENTVDLYQRRADELRDKAKKADGIAKQKKQQEQINRARDDLRKQQQKMNNNPS